MEQDKFRKSYTCHRFSEIFQCVINRRRDTHSYFFSKTISKSVLRMENLGQIHHKHKIYVEYFIVTWPKGGKKISKKNIIQVSINNYF